MQRKALAEQQTEIYKEHQHQSIRNANRRILLNKGVTRPTKKKDRNPRVKRRRKYEQALKKLKTIGGRNVYKVQDVYKGEMTGIKNTIVKSTVLDQ